MQSKSLLIAIAAFALTATSAQAFVPPRYLAEAGLSTSQQEALEEARSLRKQGEISKARNLLIGAGLDENSIESLRAAAKAAREALHKAILDKDYQAFKEATEGTPLADIVTTEADFKQFVKAHELRQAGEHDQAMAIRKDLGLEKMIKVRGEENRPVGPLKDLTIEQREAYRAAHQANDKETMKEVLRESGYSDEEIASMTTRHHSKTEKKGEKKGGKF